MAEDPAAKSKPMDAFSRAVGAKEARKAKAQRKPCRSAWFGFGLFGLIGWSVVVPTLLGIALGVWLDRHHPRQHSWTLMLLVLGLAVGCLNAWHWVAQEHRDIRQEEEDNTHE